MHCLNKIYMTEKPTYYGPDTYANLDAFYPYYLSEHTNTTNRRLHVVGNLITYLIILYILVFDLTILNLFLGFVQWVILGYAFAWTGHFFFEKNKPATISYPWLSLYGDFRLFTETLTCKRPF